MACVTLCKHSSGLFICSTSNRFASVTSRTIWKRVYSVSGALVVCRDNETTSRQGDTICLGSSVKITPSIWYSIRCLSDSSMFVVSLKKWFAGRCLCRYYQLGVLGCDANNTINHIAQLRWLVRRMVNWLVHDLAFSNCCCGRYDFLSWTMYTVKTANRPLDNTGNNPMMLQFVTDPVAPFMLLTFTPCNNAQDTCRELTDATRHHHNARQRRMYILPSRIYISFSVFLPSKHH